MKLFYTLAHSKIGTHKMRFKHPTNKEKAIITGTEYCKDNNLEYIGTYDRVGIDKAETKFLLANY